MVDLHCWTIFTCIQLYILAVFIIHMCVLCACSVTYSDSVIQINTFVGSLVGLVAKSCLIL